MLFPFLTLLHWKPNTLIHHKVNGPNFILSLDNLNEWISPWLSQRRFNITWPPSLFLMGRRVVYLASLILFLYFLSDVCFWVEYENVVLHRLPFFRLLFTYRLIFRRIPSTFTYFYPTRKVVFICHSFNGVQSLVTQSLDVKGRKNHDKYKTWKSRLFVLGQQLKTELLHEDFVGDFLQLIMYLHYFRYFYILFSL